MIDINKIQTKKPLQELFDFSIINIDKPAGPTSFALDLIIKNSLNLNKTSHFGTLDPIVVGVLPISLNRACRLMNYFITKTKTYVGIMRLHQEVEINELKQEMKKFIGEITQLPPVKSCVKRKERQREVYSFNILEISENKKDILFETKVQAGTYIRKLIHNLGEKIGGAHMLELRRTKASIFEEKNSHTIYEFLEAVEKYKKGDENDLRKMLIPGEIISEVLPVIQIKTEFVDKLQHGSPLFKEYLENEKRVGVAVGGVDGIDNDFISVFYKDQFIGVFKIINDKQIMAKPEFVLQPIKYS